MAVWVCDSSAATSPVPSGSISPPGARGWWGGRRWEDFYMCNVCFGMSRGKTWVERMGGGLMFWRFRWCAGIWGGKARPVRDRGKTRSRHRRSRSCECRGSWGNTALLGRTGPDTPGDTDRRERGLRERIYTHTQAHMLQKGKDASERSERQKTQNKKENINIVQSTRRGLSFIRIFIQAIPNHPGRVYGTEEEK